MITIVFATIILSGLSAVASASSSAYSEYCSLHPNKTYCWNRHRRVRHQHNPQQGEDSRDVAGCDRSNDPDLSIKACSKLIETNPQDDVAHFNRGVGYDDKKEYDRAIADYSAAIEINQSMAAAYSNR